MFIIKHAIKSLTSHPDTLILNLYTQIHNRIHAPGSITQSYIHRDRSSDLIKTYTNNFIGYDDNDNFIIYEILFL